MRSNRLQQQALRTSFQFTGICILLLVSGRSVWCQQVNSQVNANSENAYVSATVDASAGSDQVSSMIGMSAQEESSSSGGGDSSNSDNLLIGFTGHPSFVSGFSTPHFPSRSSSGVSSQNYSANVFTGALEGADVNSSQNRTKKSGDHSSGAMPIADLPSGVFPDTTRTPYWPSPPISDGALNFFGLSNLTWTPDFDTRHLVPNYLSSGRPSATHRHKKQYSGALPGSLGGLLNEDVSSGMNTSFGLDNTDQSLQNSLSNTSSEFSNTIAGGD